MIGYGQNLAYSSITLNYGEFGNVANFEEKYDLPIVITTLTPSTFNDINKQIIINEYRDYANNHFEKLFSFESWVSHIGKTNIFPIS